MLACVWLNVACLYVVAFACVLAVLRVVCNLVACALRSVGLRWALRAVCLDYCGRGYGSAFMPASMREYGVDAVLVFGCLVGFVVTVSCWFFTFDVLQY